MSRHFQAIAGFGLALGGTLVPSVASAQYNRVPDPNATRVMVAVFRSGEKGLGVQAADAVRSRMTSEFPFKQVYVLPTQDLTATLEASGFPVTEALEPHDQKALATLLRADEYITGTVTKAEAGVKLEAALVLARDNSLVQPLGTYEAKSVGDASKLVSTELKEARKQLEFEKKCTNAGRQGQYDAAIAAAKEGIAAYPKATLVRICWANVLITQKAPAEQMLDISKQIVDIDPKSRPGLAILAQAYRDTKQSDSAVVTLTRLLSTDPKNPRLQKDVVEALAVLANPKVARPVIDEAVQANPGDPELLRTRWLILLSTRDFKEAFAQGDELVKLDTAFADTTYFIRTAAAYAADSQFQKSAETASKGVAKFPGHPGLTYSQIVALRQAGQNQQALEALEKAIAAKVVVENGGFLRLTLLKELNRTAEVLPAAKALIAAGDTSTATRAMVLQMGNEQRTAASKSNAPDDYKLAIETLKYADEVTTGASKAQAQFLLGATYVAFGQVKLQESQAAKACAPAKEAKDMFVEAQIMLPKGGSFAPDAMRQLMGAVMQLDPSADQFIKAFCK
ncbi:MAG: tetratricopeptide repeat protein [Gemmatimonadaceae bacterium]